MTAGQYLGREIHTMAQYLIAYDLRRPEYEYGGLFDAIKAAGSTHWHSMNSTWIVVSTQSALHITNALWARMNKNDKLLVIEVTDKAAWAGFNENSSEWLKNNL